MTCLEEQLSDVNELRVCLPVGHRGYRLHVAQMSVRQESRPLTIFRHGEAGSGLRQRGVTGLQQTPTSSKELISEDYPVSLLTRVPASFINRNGYKTRQEIQSGLCWGSCSSTRKRKQVTGDLAHSLRQGLAGSSFGARAGVGLGVWPEGGPRSDPPPPMVCVQGACTALCFCPQLLRSGVSFFFYLFVSCSSFVPTAHTCGYFQSLVVLVLCCWRRCLCRCPAKTASQPGSALCCPSHPRPAGFAVHTSRLAHMQSPEVFAVIQLNYQAL